MKRPVVLLGETLVSLASEVPRPLDRGSKLDLTFAGAEVNVAIGLSRLGHPARWVSAVGDDPFGRMVLRGLRGEGVDTSAVNVVAGAPTALMVKAPRAAAEPEVLYYRRGSAVAQSGPSDFRSDAFTDAQAIYLTGITPALSDSCRDLIEWVIQLATDHGIPIWFDPNHRSKLWSAEKARATILPWLPNFEMLLVGLLEGEILTGETTPEAIGQSLLGQGAARAIVRAGEAGTWFFAPGRTEFCPIFPLGRVVDPVGAGDAFGAGVLSARLEGLDWDQALARGNAMGAFCCATLGDWEGLPTPRELQAFMTLRKDAVR